jgi:hypothetical protein
LRSALRVWILSCVSLAAHAAFAGAASDPVPMGPPGEEPAEVVAAASNTTARASYTAQGNVRPARAGARSADWVTQQRDAPGVASGDVVD